MVHLMIDGSTSEAETLAADGTSRLPKKEVDPRMHSAEHILTATLMRMLGCGRPFTTHLEKKKSKADFHFGRDLTPQEVNDLENRVNEVIGQNLEVWEEFLPRSEAQTRYNLARLPDDAGEKIRIVHIGDLDACPCSGKHVSRTSEIGRFRFISSSFDSGALRVRFKVEAGPGASPEQA